nr:photosystem II reaction center PsbP family protein [Streptomyces sp. NBC_00886]
MSGGPGPRYWNEETQRWEDGEGTGDAGGTGAVGPAAPVTPPPPPRPDSVPEWTAVDVPGDTGVPPTPPPGPAPWPTEAGTWYGPRSTGTDTGPGAWPSAEQLTSAGVPAAPPRAGFSRRLVWSVVVGAAVVGVAVSLVLTLVVDSGDDDGKGGHTVAAGSTSPRPTDVSPSPSIDAETASPSASAPELPAGYQSHEDTEGFRIAYPDGWTRSTVASSYGMDVVNYHSADDEHRLQVYQVAEGSPDASFELYLSDETPKPDGFRKIALQKLDDGTLTASRLEYTADSLKGEPDIGTWHVYDERFVASDGYIYAIAAYGPDADGPDGELELLTTALAWFCPQVGACDAASVD